MSFEKVFVKLSQACYRQNFSLSWAKSFVCEPRIQSRKFFDEVLIKFAANKMQHIK
jgi:hypothetical protein